MQNIFSEISKYTFTPSYYEVKSVVDGDSILLCKIQSVEKFEIRLYGIDCPETKFCKKLKQDERETHLAGQFLIQLGHVSTKFVRELLPVNTKVSLIIEKNNTTDIYGRTLAYLILPDGNCLNEILVEKGYAKPYEKCHCEQLSKYQILNFKAIQMKQGLYNLTNHF